MPADPVTRNDHLRAADKHLREAAREIQAAEQLSPVRSERMQEITENLTTLRFEFDLETGLTR